LPAWADGRSNSQTRTVAISGIRYGRVSIPAPTITTRLIPVARADRQASSMARVRQITAP
jgi:hypothetical protein